MATNVLSLTKRKGRKNKNQVVFILLGVGLPLLYFLVFWVYVNIDSILLAFKNPAGEWNTDAFMAALKSIFNPDEITDSTGGILISIRNTAIFFALDLLTIPFHVSIAYFLYRKIRGYRFFQIMFYLPGIISTVVLGSVFVDLITPLGPLDYILKNWFGFEMPFILQSEKTAIWVVAFYQFWVGWGGRMLLLGGAMARLPKEVLESGRLDGTNTFRELFSLVFPMLWPTISTLVILQLTSFFTASGPILVLTQGQYGTSTIAYWNYAKLKYDGLSAYNQIAAVGLILTAIGLPIILLIKHFLEKIPSVEY